MIKEKEKAQNLLKEQCYKFLNDSLSNITLNNIEDMNKDNFEKIKKEIIKKFNITKLSLDKILQDYFRNNQIYLYWIENNENLVEQAKKYIQTLDKKKIKIDSEFLLKFSEKVTENDINSESFYKGTFIFNFFKDKDCS